MRRVALFAFWGVVALVGLPVFGVLVNLLASSFIRPAESTKAATEASVGGAVQLVNAQAAAISAIEVGEVLSIFSKYTDIQKDELKDRIRGKVVEWNLPVWDVSRRSGGIVVVQTDSSEGVGTFCTVQPRSDQETARLVALRSGDRITCKGVISGFTLGNVTLSPAMLR